MKCDYSILFVDRLRRYGEIRVKVGRYAGRVVNRHPEYDECVRAARAHNVTLEAVMTEARAVCERMLAGGGGVEVTDRTIRMVKHSSW